MADIHNLGTLGKGDGPSQSNERNEDEDGKPTEKRPKVETGEISEDSCDEEETAEVYLCMSDDNINATESGEMVFSKNTHKNTKWATETFKLWIEERGACEDAKVPDDLLENPPEPRELSKWLSLFITEVRSRDGRQYPPKTIDHLLRGLQRYIRNVTPSYPGFWAAPGQSGFSQLHRTMQHLFTQLRMQGIGKESKAAIPLTSEEEKQLWSSGVLHPGNPLGLLRAVYFSNEKNLSLGGGHCHRQLKLSQFKRETNPDHYIFTKITSKPQTEKPLIPIHSNPLAGARCHVLLLDIYLSKLPPQAFKHDDFYLNPVAKTPVDLASPWYSTNPIGKNQLQRMFASMCAEAGIPGHRTVYSLRAPGALKSRQLGLAPLPSSLLTYSLNLNSPTQCSTEALSIVPTVVSTTSQPSLSTTHGPTHSLIVGQLGATRDGLDDEVMASSNTQPQGKIEKTSSPTSSSQDASPHRPRVQNPLHVCPLDNDRAESLECEPSSTQEAHWPAQLPFSNGSKTWPQDTSTPASYKDDTKPGVELGERVESPNLQTIDSAADNANLSHLPCNRPLFVVLDDSQLATEQTSHALALSSSIQQAREVTSRSGSHSQSISGDLQEALILLSRGKEEAETTILALQQKLEEQEKELVIAQTELQQMKKSHIQKHQALERENDLLREELKRGIELVESHQHQQSTAAMSEMCGELMEFNDKLHKQIKEKDAIIVRLGQTITMARIEMPVPTSQLPPEALQPRKLVEVCIPSVIKRECGSDSHHAYQVHVKLGGDEWNVYRSFDEFLEFHRQISVHLPEVAEFNFARKEATNNESAQVVAERGKRIQDYLRLVLEVCSKPTAKRKRSKSEFIKPIIPVTVTKNTFLQTFPFFRDSATV